MEHEENEKFPTEHITSELICSILQQFIGDIEQVPPTYSAVKINGDRACDLRRAGEEVTLRTKNVHIDEIEVTDFDVEKMLLSIRVVCGKGTYIRALARDLGRALGSGAYLTALRRTRVGDYTIDKCLDYEQIKEWLVQTDK
jgi:tRNA pseudouridine55 synthase